MACESGISRKRRDVGAVTGIGGTADVFEMKWRATVRDEITGETICQKEATTGEGKDSASVKKELRAECKEARELYDQRAAPIVEELPKLWGGSKAKPIKVMGELERKENKKGKKDKASGKTKD